MDSPRMDSLFVRSLLKDALLLKPNQLGSNFRQMIQMTLRGRVEGVCSRHGYIMPGSFVLHKVGSGRLEAVSLNGDVRFDVLYYAKVCNPPVGAIVPCRVVNTNKFGILAHAGIMLAATGDFIPVMEIIVPKQHITATGESEIDLDAVRIGDNIRVEIVGKKFEIGDDKISVIARAIDEKGRSSGSVKTDAVSPSPPNLPRFATVAAFDAEEVDDRPDDGFAEVQRLQLDGENEDDRNGASADEKDDDGDADDDDDDADDEDEDDEDEDEDEDEDDDNDDEDEDVDEEEDGSGDEDEGDGKAKGRRGTRDNEDGESYNSGGITDDVDADADADGSNRDDDGEEDDGGDGDDGDDEGSDGAGGDSD